MNINKKEILRKAEEKAILEIEKHGLPGRPGFELSRKKGMELAEKLKADPFVVEMGTILMDLKLGEAFAIGNPAEHVEMSRREAKKFLRQFNLPDETMENVLACIKEHHNANGWKNIEAEICANADCYRFLTVRGWLRLLHSLSGGKGSFENDFSFAKEKFEEKLNILSLEICKKELEPQIDAVRRMIDLCAE
ncbi:MAG: hypothetical protein WC831_06455 [Parcubacteria group bacterium]|jgi:hypothetical protein